MTLLLGDETTSYTDSPLNITNGDIWAFQFTALASGTIDTLEIYATDDELYFDNAHLHLAVLSDNADAPDALIGNVVTWTGIPTGNTWLGGTGAAAPVISGHKYWLAAMSYGDAGPGNAGPVGVNLAHGDDELGTNAVRNDDESHSTIPSTWPGTSVSDTIGPLAFRALGDVTAAVIAIHEAPELRFQVTTLRYPDAAPVVLTELEQFTDGEVGIPLNEGRDGQVTISVYDPAYRALAATYDGSVDEYAAMLRCFYDGKPVLWAPVTGAPFRGDAGTVTLTASDKVRLENHEVVIGDEAIDKTNAFGGRIPVDYRGLRLLRDAAINLPGQTARGVPDIGIADGTNDQPANDVYITIQRGTEVWSAWTDLVSHGASPGHEGAPDFELEPRVDLPSAYCQLNTYLHQGQDKTRSIVFHYGWGRDNLAGFDSDPLGKIITHQHALGHNNKIRETRADLASSAYRGLFVKWDSQDYGGSDADIRVALGAWAQQQVEAYSIPVHVVKITLRPEAEITDPLGRFRYLRDFVVGDEVHAEAHKGFHRETASGRIVKVTLRQQDQGKVALADLDITPNVAGDGTATEDD